MLIILRVFEIKNIENKRKRINDCMSFNYEFVG